MSFTPRLTAPSYTDKNWIGVGYGGYNKCMVRNGSTGSVLPNCPGYAWGRFMEILGSTPKLSTHAASKWWSYTQDGYKRGKTPQLGAVICWGGGNYGGAGHVAIVEKINSDGSILTSNSNYSGKRFYTMTCYGSNNYRITSHHYFQGFIYNPKYDSGGSLGSGDDGTIITDDGTSGGTIVTGNLYDRLNTEEDATVREVGYINSKNEPSIQPSDIRLSVINYTTALGAVFNTVIKPQLGYMSITGGGETPVTTDSNQTANTDKLDSVPRQIVNYLMGQGLNAAAGIGICANIYHECGFNIGQRVVDSNGLYSYGMCMWNGSRGTAMVNHVGSNWRTNLTGQCSYLMKELRGGYKSKVLDPLLKVPNNESGARSAAKTFCIHFEVPAKRYIRAEERAKKASELWKKISIQLTTK